MSALISEIWVRKNFCKVSNLPAKTDKLSFGLTFCSFSIGVEISKSIVLWDLLPPSSAWVMCCSNLFAKVPIRSEFSYNFLVETRVSISSSRSSVDKSLIFCLLLFLMCWILSVMSVRLKILECNCKLDDKQGKQREMVNTKECVKVFI